MDIDDIELRRGQYSDLSYEERMHQLECKVESIDKYLRYKINELEDEVERLTDKVWDEDI